jgi:hypothetical protein
MLEAKPSPPGLASVWPCLVTEVIGVKTCVWEGKVGSPGASLAYYVGFSFLRDVSLDKNCFVNQEPTNQKRQGVSPVNTTERRFAKMSESRMVVFRC